MSVSLFFRLPDFALLKELQFEEIEFTFRLSVKCYLFLLFFTSEPIACPCTHIFLGQNAHLNAQALECAEERERER